jgi:hypothetical protein
MAAAAAMEIIAVTRIGPESRRAHAAGILVI